MPLSSPHGRRAGPPTGSSPTAPVVLSCQKVEVSYGPVQILFGVDLDVHEGEIVALLGTNGAGKSTLLKGASGLVKVGGGAVSARRAAIAGEPAEAMARRGLSLMPGGRGVFPTLTVDENLRLGTWMIRKDHRAVGRGQGAGARPLPDSAPAGATSRRATSRAASSRCCRWPWR